jgi:serine/threonine protein phosphatase PrpC
MGSIVLQVNGTTVGNVADGAGVEIVRAVSEEDSARLIEALGNYYDTHFHPTNANALEKTTENIIKVWWEDVIRQAKKHVERYETKKITVAPIEVFNSTEELTLVKTSGKESV